MTPEETAQLLAYISAADDRFYLASHNEAQVKAHVWSELIDENITLAAGIAEVRRFYATKADRRITPADINNGYAAQREANYQQMVNAHANREPMQLPDPPYEVPEYAHAREQLDQAYPVKPRQLHRKEPTYPYIVTGKEPK